MCVFVDDVDAHCAHARAAGAEIFGEPETNDYGAEAARHGVPSAVVVLFVVTLPNQPVDSKRLCATQLKLRDATSNNSVSA